MTVTSFEYKVLTVFQIEITDFNFGQKEFHN